VGDSSARKTVAVRVKSAGLSAHESGLFSFREIPLLLKALEKIPDADLLLVNGHGLAHPRRFGLASHLGLIFDRPSIGCADTPLVGDYDEPPPGVAGAYTILRDSDEPVGAALRSKVGSRPIFVSPGHRMDVISAVDTVMSLVRAGRWPEPLLLADQVARRAAAKKKP
jgi:deoxyribonuclease V